LKRVGGFAVLAVAAIAAFAWATSGNSNQDSQTSTPAGASVQAARVETPEPTVGAGSVSTPDQADSPEPSSTPLPVPTDTPVPPTSTPDPCTLTLQQVIDSAFPGEVLDLSSCTYNQPATINKSLTLLGGALHTQTSDRWAVSLDVRADNVTIDGWSFMGGGLVIALNANSNVKLLNNRFREHIGSPIAMWGGVNGVLIEGNDIVNTRTRQGDILFGRGSEGSNPCPTVGRNVTIRNNYGDQGPGNSDKSQAVGWFGIELKCFEDVLIEGNSLRGGHVLISLPDSNRVTIRNNQLDLTGFTFYGVEIPKAHDITIEYNTVTGDGPNSGETAFSANSGSQRMTIRYNTVENVGTLVDDPRLSVVTDNCVVNVTNIYEFGEDGTNTIERNGPC
jgi:hypothetical protein